MDWNAILGWLDHIAAVKDLWPIALLPIWWLAPRIRASLSNPTRFPRRPTDSKWRAADMPRTSLRLVLPQRIGSSVTIAVNDEPLRRQYEAQGFFMVSGDGTSYVMRRDFADDALCTSVAQWQANNRRWLEDHPHLQFPDKGIAFRRSGHIPGGSFDFG